MESLYLKCISINVLFLLLYYVVLATCYPFGELGRGYTGMSMLFFLTVCESISFLNLNFFIVKKSKGYRIVRGGRVKILPDF
jgi:hypothetical protein